MFSNSKFVAQCKRWEASQRPLDRDTFGSSCMPHFKTETHRACIMGNCDSGCGKKKKKHNANENEGYSVDVGDPQQPHEDVTYASIDHNNSKHTTTTRVTVEAQCDYATVNMPQAPVQEAESDYATVSIPRAPLQEAESDYATVSIPRAPLQEAESDYATVTTMPREPLQEAEFDCSSREYISMN